jgi:16S rRNA (guanine527-N7)-methyltransferase
MDNFFHIFNDFSFADDLFLEKCRHFYSLLLEENSHTNLTRITKEKEFFIKHVYDSLLIFKFKPELISSNKIKIADLGCGAGFPAIILAMVLPQTEITAIDSIAKKTNFVKKTAENLQLENLNVLTGRGRELAVKPEFTATYDIITARAVAEINKLYREIKRMLKPGAEMIFYKTPEAAQKEISSLNKLSSKLNWSISDTILLPEDMGERCFVTAVQSP